MMRIMQKPLSSYSPDNVLLAQEIMLSGMSEDSRQIKEGELFLAFSGQSSDGRQYIDQAIDNGAAAIFVEQDKHWRDLDSYRNTPIIAVPNLQSKIAAMSADFYDHPSQAISVIGVTGTNAKTSCSHYLQQLLTELNKGCGIIGTLGWGVGSQVEETGNTTPGSVLLQKILFNFVQKNLQYAALEVSSHGLALGRVDSVDFKVAILTNISRDHLDFHGSMAAYVDAKKKLFAMSSLDLAIINADDEHAQAFYAAVNKQVRVLSYGFSAHADVRIEDFESSLQGMSAVICYQEQRYALQTQLIGDFNIYNLSAVIACLLGLNFPLDEILEQIPAITPVKGRMQRVNNDQALTVLVDYAHTPDGLEKVLQTLKKHNKEHTLWCVFGCGGDRDQGKRSLMGEVVARYADKIIVTSDNPRSEDPHSIIANIVSGIQSTSFIQEADRAAAIKLAIQEASSGDCILIAGKGHENYQEVKGKRFVFSDYAVASQALLQRAGALS